MGQAQKTSGTTWKLDSEGLTILEEDGLMQISLIIKTGTCTLLWNKPFREQAGMPITLDAGTPFTVSANGNGPIDELTITANGGITSLVFQ